MSEDTATSTVQEIHVPVPEHQQEPPEREEIIGDDYAIVYTRSYKRETKKFSTYFWFDNYRKDTEKGRKLKELLETSDFNKEVEFDGLFFTKVLTKTNKTMVFKKTKEEHDAWKGSASGKPYVKKKVKQVMTLLHDKDTGLEEINYALSEEGGNWDLFSVSSVGVGQLVFTLFKT